MVLDYTMEDEFPEVIELCIGGTHNYTALRSTLTRDENSVLAAMFTGEQPVYKNKEGRYFLNVDGLTFKTVLEYLKFGTFRLLSTSKSWGGGLFGGEFSKIEIKTIYLTASSLKLGQLMEFLENCFPVYADVKLEEYRTSTVGYFESLAQVLASIPPQSLLLQRHFSVRLVNNSDVKSTPACCEHVCQYNVKSSALFGGTVVSSYSVDVLVKVAVEVDCTLLSILCYDLAERGFDVEGRESSCYYVCSKRSNAFGGTHNTQCCRQELFILHFRVHLPTAIVALQDDTFGSVQHASTGGCFGQAQPAQNFFGQAEQTQSSFGKAEPTQSSFGQAKSTKSFFGQAQPNQSLFGQAQPNQSPFGQAQPTQNHFGQAQPTQSPFGQAQPTQSPFVQAQPTQTPFGQTQPNQSLFGQAQPTQRTQVGKGFTFGL
ncbi:BTB/POZ domain-containing protein KCTD7-like [Dreissena polymorpha]|uniref:BTB/POZ domain-containing protein KCTD7-like n=1 Tax=Dreissena polymorpha TaxID=45954 RepID=UPI002264CC2D|nr:BTB/POZ domain-containing protein KCTD7-like [Dreissena polymorpha]